MFYDQIEILNFHPKTRYNFVYTNALCYPKYCYKGTTLILIKFTNFMRPKNVQLISQSDFLSTNENTLFKYKYAKTIEVEMYFKYV